MNISKATRIKRLTFFSKRLKRPKRPGLETPNLEAFSSYHCKTHEFFETLGPLKISEVFWELW
jgi:hypothetical protein